MWYSQGIKHENLLDQDLDRSCGWKYRCLCSVPPPLCIHTLINTGTHSYSTFKESGSGIGSYSTRLHTRYLHCCIPEGTDPPAGVIKVFIPPKIKVITLGYLLSAVAVDETDRQRSSTKNHHKALHFIFPGDRESANLARVFRREISRDLRLVPAQATPMYVCWTWSSRRVGAKHGLWTLDWTLDWTHGLDCGLRFGLDFGLIRSSMTTISNTVLH